MTEVRITEKKDYGLTFFELKNEELTVHVTNLGCHILSIFAKDRDGKAEDVVLGFENVEDCHHDGSCMGAIVGRVANRIGNAWFELNGKTYHLAANAAPNHHHGGKIGFDQKLFVYEILEDGVCFSYLSPNGEEGYPGNLYLQVIYRLCGNELKMEYDAKTDEDTLINITNHSYFNLSAGREKIYHEELKIAADQIGQVDGNGLATGSFLNVTDTPFDFRKPHEIGERIDANHEQPHLAGGYDHAFVLNRPEDQVVLYDRVSGRKMTMSTTLPVVQVYTANFLAGGANGKGGKPYENRDGVALEAQYMSNSIHIEKEPKVILRKGQKYHEETICRFEVE